MPKTLRQAWMFEQGESFIWKGESYVIVLDEGKDYLIVHRTVNASGEVIPDDQRHDERFNPYCYVEEAIKVD